MTREERKMLLRNFINGVRHSAPYTEDELLDILDRLVWSTPVSGYEWMNTVTSISAVTPQTEPSESFTAEEKR